MSPILCQNCHASIDADDRFCSACGTKLVKAASPNRDAVAEKAVPLRWQQVVEAREHAYVCQIPQGWHAQLVLSRDAQGIGHFDFIAMDASGSIKIESPSKTMQYSLNPMMMFSGYQLLPMLPATKYVERVLVPQIQRSHTSVKIEAIVHRPDLAQKVTQENQNMGGEVPGGSYQVAMVQYTFIRNGVLFRQKDYVLTMYLPQQAFWTAKILYCLSAPAHQFKSQEVILTKICDSVHPHPQWLQMEVQRNKQVEQRLNQQAVNKLHAAAQQQQQINQMQQDVFNNMNAHMQQRQAAQDQVQHRMHNILQGVQDAVDDQGNLYQVNYGAYQYYGDGNKAYGLGFWDQPKLNWRPLKLTGD